MQGVKAQLSLTWEMEKAHCKSMLRSHCRVGEPRCFFSTHHYCNDAAALLQFCFCLWVPVHDTASAQPRCISAVSPAAPFYRRSGTSRLSPLQSMTQPFLLLPAPHLQTLHTASLGTFSYSQSSFSCLTWQQSCRA